MFHRGPAVKRAAPELRSESASRFPRTLRRQGEVSPLWLDRFRQRHCEGMSFVFEVEKKGGERHVERRCDLDDVLEAQITLAALDGAHESAMDAAFVGKAFLRIAAFGPQLPDAPPQSPQERFCKSLIHIGECSRTDAATSTVFT